jgi:transposase
LEAGGLRQTLANPTHIRAIPGHKTDAHDAHWIHDLHRYGLVPASFVPSRGQRELRELTRMRSKVVQDRTRVVNRMQAMLEDANIKLASVVSDVMGASAQRMLQGLIQGNTSPAALAELAYGSLRAKRPELALALDGNFNPHHAFLLRRLLIQAHALEAQERALERQITRSLTAEQKAVIERWRTIPGVGETVATVMVAELGIHPAQFPDAQHAASWVAICPGNHESAGNQKSGKTRKGNVWLRSALVEAAWVASRSKSTYLAALFHRLVGRKGKQRALLAVAHSILISAYHMLQKQEPYHELGGDYFDRIQPDQLLSKLVSRINRMGFGVILKPENEPKP